MNIVTKRIEEIQPYENNPRKNDRAVEYVANSIKEFGWKVPIVIDKNDVIIAGHTRYLAAMELGIEKVPCVIADDLTPEQVKAYRLADNKVTEKSSWDFDLLLEELNDLEISDIKINMEDFGFFEQNYDIDNFFSDIDETEKKPENGMEIERSDVKKIQCPNCGEWIEI